MGIIMNMQWKLRTIGIFLVSLFLVGFSINCNKELELPDDDPVVIKIGDYEVTVNQYIQKINALRCFYSNDEDSVLKKHVLNHFISEGLLCEYAKKKNAGLNLAMKRQLKEYRRSTLIAAAKQQKLAQHESTADELKIAYKRSKDAVVIGDIYVQKNQEHILDEILAQTDAGATYDDLETGTGSNENDWEKKGVVFNRRMLTGELVFGHHIDATIYKMKVGDIKVFNTKSGYHQIHLLERIPKKRKNFVYEREILRQKIASNKLELSGGVAIDSIGKIFKIRLNENLLSSLDVRLEDSLAIASFQDDKITIGELKKIIATSPIDVQYLAIDKSTREKVAKVLIMMNMGFKPELPDSYKLQKNRFLIENLVKKILAVNEGFKDTLEFNRSSVDLKQKVLTDWMEKTFAENNPSSVEKLLLEEAYQQKIDSKIGNPLHGNGAKSPPNNYPWLYPESFDRINELEIDTELLDCLAIPVSCQIVNEWVVAKSSNRTITIEKFFHELDKLKANTRRKVLRKENIAGYIEFITHPDNIQSSKENSLFIDYKLLKLATYYYNYTRPFEKFNPTNYALDTLAWTGNTPFSIKEIKEKLNNISLRSRSRLKFDTFRKNALDEFLTEEAWLNLALKQHLNNNPHVEKKIQLYKNGLFAQMIYNEELRNLPAILNDSLLGIILNGSINEFLKNRFNEKLAQFTKTLDVSLNTVTLQKYELNLSASNYHSEPDDVIDSYMACPGSGSILCEFWENMTGNNVSQLKMNPDFPDNPTDSFLIPNLECLRDWGDSYGICLRGYVHPFRTGNYTFRIASDNRSELWLSLDEKSENKELIARVLNLTPVKMWYKYHTQHSFPVLLIAGKKYYIEALFKEDQWNDHLEIAWSLNGDDYTIVQGDYLSGI